MGVIGYVELDRGMLNKTVNIFANVLQMFYYLRQVNEVNDGDNVFVRCVSVCLCVRSGPVGLKC